MLYVLHVCITSQRPQHSTQLTVHTPHTFPRYPRHAHPHVWYVHRLTVMPIVTALLEYRDSMLADGAKPPLALRQRAGGQWVAQVWPAGMVPAFFPGFSAEIWVAPGMPPSQGELYKRKPAAAAATAPSGEAGGAGGVALVLGACCSVITAQGVG